jgi:hypothetical protein
MEKYSSATAVRLLALAAASLLSGCAVSPLQQGMYYYPQQRVYVEPAPIYAVPGGYGTPGYAVPYGYPSYVAPDYGYLGYNFGYPHVRHFGQVERHDWDQRRQDGRRPGVRDGDGQRHHRGDEGRAADTRQPDSRQATQAPVPRTAAPPVRRTDRD